MSSVLWCLKISTFPDTDICSIVKMVHDQQHLNPLANFIVGVINKWNTDKSCVMPDLMQGCPYPAGWYAIRKLDINATLCKFVSRVNGTSIKSHSN